MIILQKKIVNYENGKINGEYIIYTHSYKFKNQFYKYLYSINYGDSRYYNRINANKPYLICNYINNRRNGQLKHIG